ncbi:MAG TPA: hypothetical protein VEH30_06445 [Terriglobales bacterium]|nr:hypothetical protein [Terriglobales bacterium]
MPSRNAILTALLALTAGFVVAADEPAKSVPVVELVRETVQNEIRSDNGNAKFIFTDHKETPRGSQVKLIVETMQGTAGMLVTENGRPLTPGERRAEEARLDGLVHNPAELRKKQKSEREDSDRTNRIIKALPDAFIFEPDGTETGSEGTGNPGDELVRLKFHPNPSYSPPSHTEQVLTGMSGYILIDANRKRIAKIDGTLFREVGFGWGILGRLDRGGRFLVQQGTVKDNDWEVTRMDLSFTGRELLFKKLFIKSDEFFTDFRPAPSNLTFAQAVELLKKQGAEIAENHQQNGSESHDPR